jgi:peptidoglycan hydrolase-like protein with peptidoglycan-binding domain
MRTTGWPRVAPALVAAATALAACSHARHREGGSAAGGSAAPQGRRPGPAPRPITPAPGEPPIAATPQGLLQPGAGERIQEALEKGGYLQHHRTGQLDEPTSAALRRYQQDHALAATGAPDRETLQKLGLDPDQVLRKSSAGPDRP